MIVVMIYIYIYKWLVDIYIIKRLKFLIYRVMTWFVIGHSGSAKSLARPKSAILSCPSEARSKLLGFKSFLKLKNLIRYVKYIWGIPDVIWNYGDKTQVRETS